MNRDLETVENFFTGVKALNDFNLEAAKKIHIILLNLKIEQSKITQDNGLGLIIKDLDKLNNEIKTGIENFIRENRQQMADAVENLKGEIK